MSPDYVVVAILAALSVIGTAIWVIRDFPRIPVTDEPDPECEGWAHHWNDTDNREESAS